MTSCTSVLGKPVYLLARTVLHRTRETHLVLRENECVGDNNVLPSGSGENNHLGDVVGSQRFHTPSHRQLSR